jgi:hypothetical protein
MPVLPSASGVGDEPYATTFDHMSAGAPRLSLSVLGPLDVRLDGEPVDLGGAKPRALLALLLLERALHLSTSRGNDDP